MTLLFSTQREEENTVLNGVEQIRALFPGVRKSVQNGMNAAGNLDVLLRRASGGC
ncbi:hypothetical protein [Deinococcus fonticola]|uniref:hypothetical protein n=1 Tax=Deinococcus fonticola TaxID=2528713 RepID=UPI00142FE32E|nr:hypothetical protein [Deinococcus fonticola]